MFSKKLRELVRSVAFRLTVWYTLLFGCVLLGGGVMLYYRGSAHIQRIQDLDLLSDLKAQGPTFAEKDVSRIRVELAAASVNLSRGDTVFRLLSVDGQTLAACSPVVWEAVPVDPSSFARLVAGVHHLQTVPLATKEGNLRMVTARISADRILQIGMSTEDNDHFLDHLLDVALVIFVGMLALGAVIGWLMARRAMAGVEGVTVAAARIAEGHFADRVRVPDAGTEIEQLGHTFNRMAERLQTLMREMLEVNDNIAHDLRSPLTCIRGLAEAAALRAQTAAEAAETAGSIIEECDRLLGLINTMLDIAEAEAGLRGLDRQTISLAEVVNRAVELFQAVAEEKGVSLNAAIHAEPVLQADLRKLQRALANLLDNALKYSKTGDRVTVTLSRQAGAAVVAVSDTGAGIPARDLPLIFHRFYRGDSSRHLPGNGLGLSLASAIVRAHGGTLSVESALGQGSTFTLTLPCAPIGPPVG